MAALSHLAAARWLSRTRRCAYFIGCLAQQLARLRRLGGAAGGPGSRAPWQPASHAPARQGALQVRHFRPEIRFSLPLESWFKSRLDEFLSDLLYTTLACPSAMGGCPKSLYNPLCAHIATARGSHGTLAAPLAGTVVHYRNCQSANRDHGPTFM